MSASRPIRRKLVTMSLSASSGALLLACMGFMAFDFVAFRQGLSRSISNLSEIIGINSASALAHKDPEAAKDTLASLQVRRSIQQAGIYLPDGRLFASWSRSPNTGELPTLPKISQETQTYSRHSLDVFRPIVIDGVLIGTVFIRSDLKDLITRFIRYFQVSALVLLLSLILAAFISYRVGEKISTPILRLVDFAKAISENKDYSVRAVADSPDEVGRLVKTFNEMLTKIQADGRELQAAHEDLERRVRERTVQLTVANQELESFSYSVSHDLRSPLRAIDGFSRKLLEDSAKKLDASEQADLNRIRAATQRMARLIDDLLELSRVSRSEMTREKIDLSELAEKILNELGATQPKRRMEIRVTPHLSVYADAHLSQILLENLLGNAWKFTEKKPAARIEFGQTQRQGKKAFFVQDNGAGFNMAFANKLFKPFSRMHESNEYPGTGIGLATVHRIVSRHGGEIWAESEVDQGTTFYFTLA